MKTDAFSVIVFYLEKMLCTWHIYFTLASSLPECPTQSRQASSTCVLSENGMLFQTARMSPPSQTSCFKSKEVVMQSTRSFALSLSLSPSLSLSFLSLACAHSVFVSSRCLLTGSRRCLLSGGLWRSCHPNPCCTLRQEQQLLFCVPKYFSAECMLFRQPQKILSATAFWWHAFCFDLPCFVIPAKFSKKQLEFHHLFLTMRKWFTSSRWPLTLPQVGFRKMWLIPVFVLNKLRIEHHPLRNWWWWLTLNMWNDATNAEKFLANGSKTENISHKRRLRKSQSVSTNRPTNLRCRISQTLPGLCKRWHLEGYVSVSACSLLLHFFCSVLHIFSTNNSHKHKLQAFAEIAFWRNLTWSAHSISLTNRRSTCHFVLFLTEDLSVFAELRSRLNWRRLIFIKRWYCQQTQVLLSVLQAWAALLPEKHCKLPFQMVTGPFHAEKLTHCQESKRRFQQSGMKVFNEGAFRNTNVN